LFNDVNKEGYPDVLAAAPKYVRKGGLFITDNVLWSGRVTEAEPREATTRAIQGFNHDLKESRDWFTTILPLRDGVAVCTRL
jgi:caffeoyl-CoA O-methyltransferase